MDEKQRQQRDHVVVTISVKRVTFEPLTQGSGTRGVANAMGVPAERRVVGDVLQASVTGLDVASARKRAIAVLETIDDHTPSTNLKHEAMRGEENR